MMEFIFELNETQKFHQNFPFSRLREKGHTGAHAGDVK
jgi:hypothetical protein